MNSSSQGYNCRGRLHLDPTKVDHIFDCIYTGQSYHMHEGRATFSNQYWDTNQFAIWKRYNENMNESSGRVLDLDLRLTDLQEKNVMLCNIYTYFFLYFGSESLCSYRFRILQKNRVRSFPYNWFFI